MPSASGSSSRPELRKNASGKRSPAANCRTSHCGCCSSGPPPERAGQAQHLAEAFRVTVGDAARGQPAVAGTGKHAIGRLLAQCIALLQPGQQLVGEHVGEGLVAGQLAAPAAGVDIADNHRQGRADTPGGDQVVEDGRGRYVARVVVLVEQHQQRIALALWVVARRRVERQLALVGQGLAAIAEALHLAARHVLARLVPGLGRGAAELHQRGLLGPRQRAAVEPRRAAQRVRPCRRLQRQAQGAAIGLLQIRQVGAELVGNPRVAAQRQAQVAYVAAGQGLEAAGVDLRGRPQQAHVAGTLLAPEEGDQHTFGIQRLHQRRALLRHLLPERLQRAGALFRKLRLQALQGRALRRRRIKRRGLRGEALGGGQGQCGVFVGAEGQAQALALAGLQAERLASGQLRRAQRLAVGRGGAQADAAAVDLQVEQLQLAGGKVEVALAALAGSDLDAAIGQRHGLGGLGRGQQVEEKQQRGGNGRHGISLRIGAAIRAAHRKRRTIAAEICRCDPG